jgi:hypothetical protein
MYIEAEFTHEPRRIHGCEPHVVHSSPSRAPSFGLEPKFALQISIGALPLWCFALLYCHPDDLGEILSQTYSGSSPTNKNSGQRG